MAYFFHQNQFLKDIQIKWLIRFQMHCLTSFWLTMTTLIAQLKPFVLLVR